MKQKISAVVQVRMGSGRLPGKTLMPICGSPSLYWILKRLSYSGCLDEIVIATTSDKSNDPIEDYYNSIQPTNSNITLFRFDGGENDITGRILGAAEFSNAEIICDITGDCILVSPEHIDILIKKFVNGNYDYVSNDVINRSWCDGSDIQIYSKDALIKCINEFLPKSHGGWNIGSRPNSFKTWHWEAPEKYNHPEWALVLDEQSDIELLGKILYEFGENPNFMIEDVFDFLLDNPELLDINSSVRRKDPTKES